MKTLFVSAGPYEWGSSRMRCYWPAKYMPGAEVVTWDRLAEKQIPLEYDAYIFQKIADPVVNQFLHDNGKRVYWDVCDPAWWWQPKECLEIARSVDGVVASNGALALDFSAWSMMPCEAIPDRLELSHFPLTRNHEPVETVKFIWFGVAVNRFSLIGAIANLQRLVANGHKISLTIFDNEPDENWSGLFASVPIKLVQWSVDTENEVISSHDIALLPPYPGPWGQVKSNNKRLTASACGLPVTAGSYYHDLVDLVTSPAYRVQILNGQKSAVQSVERSAREWEALLVQEVAHA